MCVETREVLAIKTIFLYSQQASAEPPLGTILGNLGVNTTKFCKDFNEFTKNLPKFIKLRVKITIFDNYSYSYQVKVPTTGVILSCLEFDKVYKVWVNDRYNDINYKCIYLEDVIKLALFKFPYYNLKNSLPILISSIKAKNMKIV